MILGTIAPGLGAALVKALAQQLDAHVVVDSSSQGTSGSIVHNASQIAAPRV